MALCVGEELQSEGTERASGQRSLPDHSGVVVLPGSVIGERYELERPLSTGGMGTLWVAHDLVLDIRVAIKLIRDDLVAESVVERLLQEARLAARVEHPAIVRVLGLDTMPSGAPFIVMELLEGQDLRQLLDRAFRISPIEAVQLLLPIASALVAAHERRVLHRDLKPENVFIATVHGRPQPKIVDFGIAAPLDDHRRRLTCAGAVVGSPDYLSPEQALGHQDVDQRADVWGFCAVLYECVTGFPPFAQSTLECLLKDVVRKPVRSLSEFGIDDQGLWPILDRGLSKDRDVRWPDMRSLGVALARWLLERGVAEDVCGRSVRSDWLANAAVTPLPQPPPPSTPRETEIPTLIRSCGAPEPPRRLRGRLVLVAVGLLLAAAYARAGGLLQTAHAEESKRIAERVTLTLPDAPPRRVESSALPTIDVEQLSVLENKPQKRIRPAQGRRRALPRGFDPVLGF
jgi:serine/threonine-protein kinase